MDQLAHLRLLAQTSEQNEHFTSLKSARFQLSCLYYQLLEDQFAQEEGWLGSSFNQFHGVYLLAHVEKGITHLLLDDLDFYIHKGVL